MKCLSEVLGICSTCGEIVALHKICGGCNTVYEFEFFKEDNGEGQLDGEENYSDQH